MAKKVKDENVFSFDDFKSELKKMTTTGSALSENNFAEIKRFTNTGNYMLNAVLSGSLLKGLPSGRIIEFAAEKQSGKTYVLMSSAREAQKNGDYVIWYDTENAIDKDFAERFGIDMDNFWYEPINIIERITKHLMQLIETLVEKQKKGLKIPRLFIVIDSLGNLASNKEFEDALKEDIKVDMTRAKALSSLFRLIAIPLNEIDATFVYSNHVYADTSSFIGGNKGKGGKGREYIASVIAEFFKAGGKDDGYTKNGVIIRAKTSQKNRFAIPNECQFHLNFKKGLNPYLGLPFLGMPFKQDWFIDLEKEGWDEYGLQYGKIISMSEFESIASKKGSKFEKELTLIQNTMFEYNGESYLFVDRNSVKKLDLGGLRDLKIAVKHLCKEVSAKDFYNEEVFTYDVLKSIDDTLIKPRFSFSHEEKSVVEEADDVEQMLDEQYDINEVQNDEEYENLFKE